MSFRMPGGRPKSTEPLIERFMKRVNKTDTCWLWTGAIQKNEYGQLCSKALWGTRFAHRWSYIYHKGTIDDGMMVRHTCDVRNCVNPAHLILGTSQENVHDMLERNPNGCHRKFQIDDILQIRDDYKTMSYSDIADKWGVGKTTVGNIIRGEIYNYF
jgi:HNH endonuclease